MNFADSSQKFAHQETEENMANTGSKALEELDAAVRALDMAGYELDYELGDEDELVAEVAGLQRAVRLFRRKCEGRMTAVKVA